MPQRESRLRRLPYRQPNHTVLVYCGAARTEPDYFEGLKLLLRKASVTVKVRSEGIDPARLVKAAANYRDRHPDVFDDVWCIADADAFDMSAAASAAKRPRVNLAVSNPCFELWLLLHHADCNAHCGDYQDVVARLKRHVAAYDKTALDFRLFSAGIGDAIVRAEKLDPTGADYSRNPSSGVWVLVRKMMGYMK
jgi:RloB-like protein